MATLRHVTTGQQQTLAARTVFGRSRRCDVRVTDDAVSGEHLAIWWGDGRWQIRDLGSTNGSLRNGERLDPGQTEELSIGDSLAVGRTANAWTVVDLDPPIAFAQRDGTRVLSRGNLLALPADEPEVLISLDARGEWIAETADGVGAIADQALLTVGEAVWRIHLPEEHRGTVDASLTAGPREAGALHFRVSRDEEYVEIRCQLGERTVELGARAHHYLLLVLARQRLVDAADADLPPSSQGWMHTEALTSMLQVAETHLNVQIFRARKQFVRAGMGTELVPIERRPGAGLVRIGTGRLQIESI